MAVSFDGDTDRLSWIFFMICYPDTTLPPPLIFSECRSAQLKGHAGLNAPPKGLRGFGEKGESWQGFVGLNGLLWNIV